MLLAIILPFISFFIRGKIIQGIVCLILQFTLIGWLPAAIWAVMSVNSDRTKKQLEKMKNEIINSQKNK